MPGYDKHITDIYTSFTENKSGPALGRRSHCYRLQCGQECGQGCRLCMSLSVKTVIFVDIYPDVLSQV